MAPQETSCEMFCSVSAIPQSHGILAPPFDKLLDQLHDSLASAPASHWAQLLCPLLASFAPADAPCCSLAGCRLLSLC